MAKRSAKPILAEILDDRGKITFSSAVDEQAPSITPHLTEPSTQELTETDFQQKLEGIQRQLRGVKLATAQQELETAKVVLQQKRVEHGTAQINFEVSKETFLTTGQKLVQARIKTAMSQDTTKGLLKEWGLQQDSIRQRIKGIDIQVSTAEAQNTEKKTALDADKLYAQFRLSGNHD